MNTRNQCTDCSAELPPDAPSGVCPQCLMGLAMTQPTAGDSVESVVKRFPTTDQLLGKFPNLEIIKLIGHGGMASVYQARQTNLDRDVALKVLAPHLSEDPAFTERFEREARTLARLNHPNIVSPLDFGQSEGYHYLVMEFVDGINLRDAILADSFDPQRVLDIIPYICGALQYAHDQGIIHRDIKPENILIDKNGIVKIADFGLAKLLQSSNDDYTLTATRQILGTLKYMAPEQIEKPDTVDHRSDLYSLGVVFYELLTGELPLGRFALPSEKASVNNSLDQVVMRTLEKEPDRRYQQASHFRTAVQSLEQDVAAASNLANNVNQGARIRQANSANVLAHLPFSAYRGHQYAHVRGIARLMDDAIEFQSENTIPIVASRPESSFLSLDEISSIRFIPGIFFSNTIEFQTNSLEAANEIPGGRHGVVKIYPKKRDRDRTKEFIARLRQRLPGTVQVPLFENPPVPPTKSPLVPEVKVTTEEIITTAERLKVQRLGLFIVGVLYGIVAIVLAFILSTVFLEAIDQHGIERIMQGPAAPMGIWFEFAFLWNIGFFVLSALSLACSYHLGRMRNFHFLVASLIVIILIMGLNIVAFPFAIWALIILCRKDTRRVFQHQTIQKALDDQGANDSDESILGRVNNPALTIAIALLMISVAIFAFRNLSSKSDASVLPVIEVAQPMNIEAPTEVTIPAKADSNPPKPADP